MWHSKRTKSSQKRLNPALSPNGHSRARRTRKPLIQDLKSLTIGIFAMTLLAGTPVTSNPAHAADVSPEDTVNALNGVFGRHAKERGSHAKGFCVAGQFAPSDEAAKLSTSPLFSGGTIPVTARFSIGGGNPKASDADRSVRGLGVRFHLKNEEELDLVMITAPVFFAATPEQFVGFLKARTADPATGKKDPAKIKAFNDANPNVLAHLNYVSNTPPPASYATASYFSTHAFGFDTNSTGQTNARWHLEPVGGFKGLSKEQEESFPDSFLEKELGERLAKETAHWDIFLQIAEDGDSIVDPTAVWPDARRKVNVGRLTIERTIEKGADNDCTGFVYDPNNLPTGISATDDPILAIRSPAYAVSFARREE